MVWIGVFVFVFPFLSPTQAIVAAVSPIYIFVLLRFVSGVPLLEKKYTERWSKDEKYLEYRKTTSLMVPWFKR
jgi:steroid 5-alpha reductase family enzyme